jgi:DNA-directed RNA polymerase subunit D
MQEEGRKKRKKGIIMQLMTVEQEGNVARIVVSKTTPAMMNALRRTIINEVPILAVHDIDFRTQTSALYDEMLAHRIGLNPLTTDYDSYDYEEITDENERSARSKLTLTLVAKGPVIVKAGEMKSKDPGVKAAYPEMPLVKLDEGQDLELEATAIMGKGKNHAKWVPGIASYYHEPIINVHKESPDKSTREKFPEAIFTGTKIDVARINTPELLDAIEGVDESVIEIQRKGDSFVFMAESFGMISPKQMITRGVSELTRMLDELQREVKRAL